MLNVVILSFFLFYLGPLFPSLLSLYLELFPSETDIQYIALLLRWWILSLTNKSPSRQVSLLWRSSVRAIDKKRVDTTTPTILTATFFLQELLHRKVLLLVQEFESVSPFVIFLSCLFFFVFRASLCVDSIPIYTLKKRQHKDLCALVFLSPKTPCI
jgi:hypothetical protein